MAANLDKRVASKITKLEVDEVFQGQKNVILGAIAKCWNYLVPLQWSPDRIKASIAGVLKPIAKRYSNITVVITDLFSRYKDLIKTIFQKAVHLVCHIHAERILRKPLRHLRATFTRRKKTLEHMRMQHHKGLKKAEAIWGRIDFLTARQHKDRKDRQDHEKIIILDLLQ